MKDSIEIPVNDDGTHTIMTEITKLSPEEGDIIIVRFDTDMQSHPGWLVDFGNKLGETFKSYGIDTPIVIGGVDFSIEDISEEHLNKIGYIKKSIDTEDGEELI